MTGSTRAQSSSGALDRLARRLGIQTAFTDGTGTARRAPKATVLEVARALGAPLVHERDAAGALRNIERNHWQATLDPVIVAWRGAPSGCELRGPAADLAGRAACVIRVEQGGTIEWQTDLSRRRRTPGSRIDGARMAWVRLRFPAGLPLGYHTLSIEHRGRRHAALVIVAPTRAYDTGRRDWGVFLPTYALHTADSWGLGDLADVRRVLEWLGALGGGVFSTLPLLATFLERRPFDPSPYAPASRLFWNELYVDPRRTPEFDLSPRARALTESLTFRRELRALSGAPRVDYRRAMALKRQVLEQLVRDLEAASGPRWQAFTRFRQRPDVMRYAAFRAVGERRGQPWPEWPAELRRGTVRQRDYDPAVLRYHAYAQWIAAEQMTDVARLAKTSGGGLYLDVPIGVHRHSYDVWAQRELFATTLAAGAPPDPLFRAGQNWGFPPQHPEAIRRDHYRYVRATLGMLAARAGVLRLDHVMGLHRLYWIPSGAAATSGAYVRYRADELYAILALESHRHRVPLVGENLGTVPRAVNRALDLHGVRRMYVQQFAIRPGRSRPLDPVPRRAVASLNTHDVPPFAAFLRGLDLDTYVARGWLTPRGRHIERRRRAVERDALARALGSDPDHERDLLRAALLRLGRSAASLVLVNLEDLWGETTPQNLPGTSSRHGNWRHRARLSFEEFQANADIIDTLRALARRRRGSDTTQ